MIPPRRVAIVTGGSSGIGRATALLLADRGLDVGVTYRTHRDAAEEVVAEIRARGRNAAAHHLDVRDTDSVAVTLLALVETLGGIDVLVNNAGFYRQVDTPEGFSELLAVHATAPWAAARALAPRIARGGRGGRIVNVTSILATEAQSGAAAYCAAKAALEMLSRVLALELAPLAITVNAVAPGHVATGQTFEGDIPDALNVTVPVIPAGRPASAAEVASAIWFLASDEAAYITGATLLIDGGLRLVTGPETLQAAIERPPGDN